MSGALVRIVLSLVLCNVVVAIELFLHNHRPRTHSSSGSGFVKPGESARHLLWSSILEIVLCLGSVYVQFLLSYHLFRRGGKKRKGQLKKSGHEEISPPTTSHGDYLFRKIILAEIDT
jgi:ABC-type Fe3+ transport system permease subunit